MPWSVYREYATVGSRRYAAALLVFAGVAQTMVLSKDIVLARWSDAAVMGERGAAAREGHGQGPFSTPPPRPNHPPPFLAHNITGAGSLVAGPLGRAASEWRGGGGGGKGGGRGPSGTNRFAEREERPTTTRSARSWCCSARRRRSARSGRSRSAGRSRCSPSRRADGGRVRPAVPPAPAQDAQRPVSILNNVGQGMLSAQLHFTPERRRLVRPNACSILLLVTCAPPAAQTKLHATGSHHGPPAGP